MHRTSLNYFKFCPVCAGKLVIKKYNHCPRLVCGRCHFVFYQNAKPTVSAFITKNKKQVLLVKRAIKPKLGYWDTPGGFLEEDEAPLTGLKREIKEELGVTLKNIKLLGIYLDEYFERYTIKTLNIIYQAGIDRGTIQPMDDVGEVKWFKQTNIPWSRLGFKWIRSALKDWFS